MFQILLIYKILFDFDVLFNHPNDSIFKIKMEYFFIKLNLKKKLKN